MASKRIIAVVTVKGGQVVKSYGYAAWRPAGGLVTALRNLDRWAADEIVVLDISRRSGLDPAVLGQIAAAKVSTPLAYGGGIRDAADIDRLMDLGCDRFVLESLLHADPARVAEIADLAGEQALIASVPLQARPDGGWTLWRPAPGETTPLDSRELGAWLGRLPVSEYLVTAVDREGAAGRFPPALPGWLRELPMASVIWFGGLDFATAAACLRAPATAAVAFGNLLHETELALPHLRAALLAATAAGSLRTVRSSVV